MKGEAQRAALGDELRAASRAIEALGRGEALPDALAGALRGRAPLPGASVSAVRDIASRTVRQLGLCRALSARLNGREPSAGLLALQQVAIAQLLDPVREDSTTVDQAVEAAKRDAQLRAGAGFLNATLRRFLRERTALLAEVGDALEARWNFPAWWVETLQRDHPAHWESILIESNRRPPLTVRVHARHGTPADYLAQLDAAGLSGRWLGAQAVRLDTPVPVERLPGWREGRVSVQDAGAQLAAPLLDARDGMRVLDACAAPGGKSTHLLELARLDLVALDVDERRLGRVRANLERLGQSATLVLGDALEPGRWHDGRPFERILVDAPCTASGIVRRQPDVRWRRRRSDMETFSAMQRRMLAALWPLLAPGGKLLYATCSVFAAEGDAVVASFLQAHPEAGRSPLEWSFANGGRAEPVSQLLPTSEGARDHDGFYYAMFEKRV